MTLIPKSTAANEADNLNQDIQDPVDGNPPPRIMLPGDILAMRFDPSRLILPNGILAKGQLMTLIGPGETGKSRIILQLAVAPSRGTSSSI